MFEHLSEANLIPKMPVLGRLDGKAFHTYTRGMERPWDLRLVRSMQAAAIYLCEQIQGCKVAFVQSDEITLLLTDWERYQTQPWFGYRIKKMCSVASSMCSVAFHQAIRHEFGEDAPKALPVFDARFWNVPRHEVSNAFLWRQQDATRNSIQMLARAHFSQKECHGMSGNQLQEMLHSKRGINWNDLPVQLKRGTIILRENTEGRSFWKVTDPPVFSQDRTIIENFLTEPFCKEK